MSVKLHLLAAYKAALFGSPVLVYLSVENAQVLVHHTRNATSLQRLQRLKAA